MAADSHQPSATALAGNSKIQHLPSFDAERALSSFCGYPSKRCTDHNRGSTQEVIVDYEEVNNTVTIRTIISSKV